MRDNDISVLPGSAEKPSFLLQIERAFHAQWRSYDSLFSSQKERSEKGKTGSSGIRSPRLSRAEGRVHIFSFSHTYPQTESGRVIRRHPSTARFTVSNLSGKMHRVSRLPAAFPTLPTSRESQDATRAPRQSLTSSAQHTLSRASPFIYARENAKFPLAPRSHRHFGYHLPFAVADTNLNLAPAANAQSPLTRDIERRERFSLRRNVTFNKVSSTFQSRNLAKEDRI